MITSLTQVAQLLPMINQEGNAQPGEGLTVLETFTYFVFGPIAFFVLISALSWIASAPRGEKRKEIAQNKSDDDNFITFIA
jgi:hypothetical protein